MQKGYVAIISVIVLTAILTIITITLTASSINSLQSSRTMAVSYKTLSAVEGCTEDVLLYLRANNSLPANIITPTTTCTITLNSHTGNIWDFKVAGSYQDYTKNLHVIAERNTTVNILDWQEGP
ncbi:MAG TPA: hypothetical protein VLA77_01980 [Candidatus Saccharimonadales bacterium]|nr:hypothetical protein [Candidatus Saccharimonadales bacterium]